MQHVFVQYSVRLRFSGIRLFIIALLYLNMAHRFSDTL